MQRWVRQAEIDGGDRPGRTTQELAEIRELNEVAELIVDYIREHTAEFWVEPSTHYDKPRPGTVTTGAV